MLLAEEGGSNWRSLMDLKRYKSDEVIDFQKLNTDSHTHTHICSNLHSSVRTEVSLYAGVTFLHSAVN